MLQETTIKDLRNIFEQETELTELIPELRPYVEIINLDLIRIHINTEIYETTVFNIITQILRANNEPGPLRIKPDIIRGTNFINYVDIIQIK